MQIVFERTDENASESINKPPLFVSRTVQHYYVELCSGSGGWCHNLKNGKEATKDTEKSPAGCAGEGKQNKGNL